MPQGGIKPILGKVALRGIIHCKTGLHIGGPGGQYEIGGLDLPVVRDPLTQEPYIPGSSLKGKLRSLLERKLRKPFNRHGGSGIYRHECTDPSCEVCRLFGSTRGKEEGHNLPARLIVRDGRLTEESRDELERIETGLRFTEWKFENALDRISSAANPRQLERVPAGAEFSFEMVYTVEYASKDGSERPAEEVRREAEQDLQNLLTAMRLLEDDYLGGHGSRGSGKVEFKDLSVEAKKADWYREPRDEFVKRMEGGSLDDLAEWLKQAVSFVLSDGSGGEPEGQEGSEQG